MSGRREGERGALGDDHAAQLAPLEAERPQQPELAGALQHAERQGVHHADRRDEGAEADQHREDRDGDVQHLVDARVDLGLRLLRREDHRAIRLHRDGERRHEGDADHEPDRHARAPLGVAHGVLGREAGGGRGAERAADEAQHGRHHDVGAEDDAR